MKTMPEQWKMHIFVLVFCSLGLAITRAADTTEATKDEKCWIDKSKPMTEANNYQDCTTADAIAAETPDCCTVGGTVACCPAASAQTGRMMKIALGILGVTLGLALILIALLYCNKKDCPCLDKVSGKVSPKWERFEESLCCCEGRVERRRMERKMAENQMQAQERYKLRDSSTITPSDHRTPVTRQEDVMNEVSLPAPPEFKEKSYGEDWF